MKILILLVVLAALVSVALVAFTGNTAVNRYYDYEEANPIRADEITLAQRKAITEMNTDRTGQTLMLLGIIALIAAGIGSFLFYLKTSSERMRQQRLLHKAQQPARPQPHYLSRLPRLENVPTLAAPPERQIRQREDDYAPVITDGNIRIS